MNITREEMIRLPHPVSRNHKPMPISDRAAQFSPFAALTGFDEEIDEAGRKMMQAGENETGQDYYPDDT